MKHTFTIAESRGRLLGYVSYDDVLLLLLLLPYFFFFFVLLSLDSRAFLWSLDRALSSLSSVYHSVHAHARVSSRHYRNARSAEKSRRRRSDDRRRCAYTISYFFFPVNFAHFFPPISEEAGGTLDRGNANSAPIHGDPGRRILEDTPAKSVSRFGRFLFRKN